MGRIQTGTAAWLLAAACSSPCLAATEAPARDEARWVERPTPADLERLAPPEARQGRIDGRVVLECVVNRSGRMQSCTVKSEAPAGMAFGAAALRAAPLYRLAPRSSEVDVEGSTVAFGVRFHFADPTLAANAPATSAPSARPSVPASPAMARPPTVVGGLPPEIARLTPPARLMRLGVVPDWQVDFMDLDRVTRSGDMVDVIRLTVYAQSPTAGDRRGQYDVSGLRFDCRTSAYSVLGIQTYDQQGRPVRWEAGSHDIQASEAGSVYVAIADIACQRGVPARLDATSTSDALDAAHKLLGG